MSLFPKSEWTDWAREWGMEHLPQKGRLFRDESVVGVRDGRLVQVRAIMLYENVAVKSPGKLAAPLLFGLQGAWMSSIALRRPKLRVEIRQPENPLQ